MEGRPELFVCEYNKEIDKDEFLSIDKSERMFAWFIEGLANKNYESKFFKIWFMEEGLHLLFKPTESLIELAYEGKNLQDARKPEFNLEITVNRSMYASDFSTFFMLLQLELLNYLDTLNPNRLSECVKITYEKHTIV